MLDFKAIFENARNQSKKALDGQKGKIDKEVEKRLNDAKTKTAVSSSSPAEVREEVKKELLDKASVDFVANAMQYGIGQRLQKIRNENNKTLDEIVAELEPFWQLDTSAISRWETGARRVSFTYLIWFAQKYDVDLNWLLTGEKPEAKNQYLEEARKKAIELSELFKKI